MKPLTPAIAGLGGAALSVVVAASPPPPAPAAPAAWARCASCHANVRGEAAEVGPNLWGVAGAKAGARPGYDYSPALKRAGLVWDKATLTRWLADTQGTAPGTTMPDQKLSPADREALTAYLLALK